MKTVDESTTPKRGTEARPSLVSQAFQFAKDRPVSTACVGIGALAIAAPALAAGPALATFGFKTSGIASNSIAAGVQKGIGSVIAPSIFSTLQSAGAGGYGVAPVYGAIQGAGAALSVGGLSGFFEGRRMIKERQWKQQEEQK